MPADIQIDIAQVRGQCDAFVNKKNGIVADLNGLRSQVSAMLTTSGGLYLRNSSPAFDNAYTKFNGDLTKAVENIEQFATSWREIIKQLEEMDSTMASRINGG